jgi:hypothetical protein
MDELMSIGWTRGTLFSWYMMVLHRFFFFSHCSVVHGLSRIAFEMPGPNRYRMLCLLPILNLVLLADVIWLFLLNFVACAAVLKPFCSAHDCHCWPSVLLHSFPFYAQVYNICSVAFISIWWSSIWHAAVLKLSWPSVKKHFHGPWRSFFLNPRLPHSGRSQESTMRGPNTKTWSHERSQNYFFA